MTVLNPPTWLQGGSHTAAGDRGLIAKIMSGRQGVFSVDDLLVEQQATADMSVKVSTGAVVVKGTESTYQGSYFCENQGDTTVVIAASDATNDRRDFIVARVYDSQYGVAVTDEWDLEVLTGTAAATPVDPTIPDNCFLLATVDVDANVTAITTAMISDKRQATGLTTPAQRGYMPGLGGLITCLDVHRPENPYVGMQIYIEDTEEIRTWNGTSWRWTGGSTDRRHAKVSLDGSDFALANATYAIVNFTNNVHMPSGWSVSSGSIVVPSAGRVMAIGSARWESNGTGQRLIALGRNGSLGFDSPARATVADYPPSGTFIQHVVGTTTVSAGDEIDLFAYQTSGLTLDISELQDFSYLSVSYI